MTATQRLLWTLLPNGHKDAHTLKATVTVSPRLLVDAAPYDLSQFGNWQNWPATIVDAEFAVVVDGSMRIPARRVPYRGTIEPKAEYWQALFPSTTPVTPYDFSKIDLSGKDIITAPLAATALLVNQLYGQLAATTGPFLPRVAQELAPLIPIARQLRDLGQLNSAQLFQRAIALTRQGFTRGIPNLADLGAQVTAFYRPLQQEIAGGYTKPKAPTRLPLNPKLHPGSGDKFGRTAPDFHETTHWREHVLAKLPTGDQLRQDIDFHRIVSALSSYSDLLRLTGLVVDLEFDRQVPDGEHTIQLEVNWTRHGATDPDVRPRARVLLRNNDFIMRPRDPTQTEVTGRYIRLQGTGGGGSDYVLLDLDADGAGIKVKNFVAGLFGLPANESSYDDNVFAPTPRSVGAPSLRSGGLTLAYSRRATSAKALFDRSAELQNLLEGSTLDSDPRGVLYAEDVVRGYRADVFDATRGSWLPLHLRDGTYTFLNTGNEYDSKLEEGMVRLSAASSTDGSNANIIKMHEAVFSWRGWSLSAPEPGKSLKAEIDPASDPNDAANTVGDGDADVPDGMPLATSFTPTRGSLPILRFGRQYAVRARLVDLAGESAPFERGDVQPADARSATVTYRRYEPLETPGLALVSSGGSIELPAEGESMGRIAIRTFNDDPTAPPPATPDSASRHIVAPRVTHRFAEMHGVLDKDGRPDPAQYSNLAALDNALDVTTITSPATPGAPDGVPSTYAVADASTGLPYLPDPWAIGIAIAVFGTEGQPPTRVDRIPFYAALTPQAPGDWPAARIIPIALTEGSGAPSYAGGVYTVPLAKGEKVQVRISSVIADGAIENMAVWQMFLAKGPGQQMHDYMRGLVGYGQHWMITPWRTLELVHATQKPLIIPAVNKLRIERKKGWTYAIPHYVTPLSTKSTAKIDLLAEWLEPDDRGDAPAVRSHGGHAYEIKLARLDAKNGNFTVGDPDATTDDSVPPVLWNEPAPPPPTNAVRHVFGDTHYRRLQYRIDGTTRYREYMPSPIANDENSLKVTSPKLTTWIPNAASPPAPKILYVIPTFGWIRPPPGSTAQSWRLGGGLRVYLERPWFDTGFTEMLGVVLPNDPAMDAATEAALKTYVTQWGSDPIWSDGRIATASPPISAFPLAKLRAPISFDGANFPDDEATDLPPGDFPVTGLRTPEMVEGVASVYGPGPLSVAPHAVGYDSDRQLWYSDIVVRPGATYFPFIRLALARYNPVSAFTCHLSSVAMAEFVQLTPDRLAIVTRKGNVAHVAIHGIAPGPARTPPGAQRGALFQVVSEILDPGADPDLGWRLADAKGALGFANPSAAASGQASNAPASPPPAAPSSKTVAKPFAPATTQLHLTQAQQLLDAGDYKTLLARPDLLSTLSPPLLWEGDAEIPAADNGARVRLVITESEVFQTDLPRTEGQPVGSRVVYAETVEVMPATPLFVAPFPPPGQSPPVVTPPVFHPLPTTPPPTRTLPPRTTQPPATTQPPPVRPFPRPVACTFSGDWTASKGPTSAYVLHLDEEGNRVTGTYAPAPPPVAGSNRNRLLQLRPLLNQLAPANNGATTKLRGLPNTSNTQTNNDQTGNTAGAFNGTIDGTIRNGVLIFTWTEYRFQRSGWVQTASGAGEIALAPDCNSFTTPPAFSANNPLAWSGQRVLADDQTPPTPTLR